MVTVTVDGKGQARRVQIDPTCVDPRDVEMLEDLVLAAISEAQTKAQAEYEQEMRKATGGLPMNIPGLPEALLTLSDRALRDVGDRGVGSTTDEFARLPGMGSKTALRLVHHLMKGSKDDTRRLARALVDVADKVRACDVCGNFSEHELCEICSNPRRDRSMLCVVEEAYEVGAIERTGQYRGLFPRPGRAAFAPRRDRTRRAQRDVPPEDSRLGRGDRGGHHRDERQRRRGGDVGLPGAGDPPTRPARDPPRPRDSGGQ